MVRAAICGAAIESEAPAVFMLMKAWTAKVEGKIYEKAFQKPGKLLTGHENPVRNRQIGDMKRNNTNTVSLWRISELKVKLNTTHAVT